MNDTIPPRPIPAHKRISNEFPPLRYRPETTNRATRAFNIAVYLIKHFDEATAENVEMISTQRIRHEIRKQLHLPVLSIKEEANGDFRANGDTIGGHFFHLETKLSNGKSGVKCVLLTPENMEIVATHLAGVFEAEAEAAKAAEEAAKAPKAWL